MVHLPLQLGHRQPHDGHHGVEVPRLHLAELVAELVVGDLRRRLRLPRRACSYSLPQGLLFLLHAVRKPKLVPLTARRVGSGLAI